jgi:hypothetical protein
MDKITARPIVNDTDLNPDGLLAWYYEASQEAVDFVLAQPEGDDDGRSSWTWLRLANGDLALAVFPRGDTYLEVAEGRFAADVDYDVENV